jgi:hypothetical protein
MSTLQSRQKRNSPKAAAKKSADSVLAERAKPRRDRADFNEYVSDDDTYTDDDLEVAERAHAAHRLELMPLSRGRMKAPLSFGAIAIALFAASPARAHFKLEAPADWLQTDVNGDPLGTGGSQKINPCGQGTPSGIVTRVRAGSTLHITLTETVPHGGHYRIALVPKYDPSTTDIPEPAVTLNAGECDTAAVEDPVVAPVLADNLFPHTQAEAVAGKVWETDIVIPNQTGNATLQIIEFMTPHPPQCFYHHCAQLEIDAVDAGALDSGVTLQPDSGTDGAAPTRDAGSGRDAGGEARARGDGGGGASPTTDDAGGGCHVGSDATPSIVTIGLFGIVAFSMARRTTRRRRSVRRHLPIS